MEQNLIDNRELISIIVPVYNAEEYLSQCLDSLIKQTYPCIEIICVNDGSSDGSINILKQYEKNDPRIIIVDKENEGVSASRNIGLKKAKGEYIMFVDADDWIDINICEKAIEAAHKYTADVVIWPYISEFCSASVTKNIFESDRFFDKDRVQTEIHRRFIGLCGSELAHPELADSLCTVWGKLYKRKILKASNSMFIDLKEIGTYEDGIFNLELFSYVDKAVYISNVFYHYRHHNKASITSIYKKDLYVQWQHLFDLMHEYIITNDLPCEYDEALNNRIALSILGLSLNEMSLKESAVKKIGNIRKILKDERYQKAYKTLDFSYFPIHWKLYYWCAKHKSAEGIYILGKIIQILRQKNNETS